MLQHALRIQNISCRTRRCFGLLKYVESKTVYESDDFIIRKLKRARLPNTFVNWVCMSPPMRASVRARTMGGNVLLDLVLTLLVSLCWRRR